MKKINDVFNYLITKEYLTPHDIKYNIHHNLLLSPFEYNLLLEYKRNLLKPEFPFFEILPLKTMSDNPIFICKCNSMTQVLDDYIGLIRNDLSTNNSTLSLRNNKEIILSRIYSEVEGSLKVEGIPSTRKRVKELIEDNISPVNKNDIIIKNMGEAIKFIFNKPQFNKDNLLKLYNILSSNCLEEEDKLLGNNYYRHSHIMIDKYNGCQESKIEEFMDSLFVFVNDCIKNNNLLIYLPHIVHYYILYIHPYFDYNGRTARMASLWISILSSQDDIIPPFISEAIDQTKSKYYQALENTRDSNNDLTYFLLYIYRVSISYYLTYNNIESIDDSLKNNMIVLTPLDKNYIKKILISFNNKFSYKDFIRINHLDISKQGALKILNRFTEYNILKSYETKSKIKLFEINKNLLIYKIPKIE